MHGLVEVKNYQQDILDKKNEQARFSHNPKIVGKVLPWEI